MLWSIILIGAGYLGLTSNDSFYLMVLHIRACLQICTRTIHYREKIVLYTSLNLEDTYQSITLLNL